MDVRVLLVLLAASASLWGLAHGQPLAACNADSESYCPLAKNGTDAKGCCNDPEFLACCNLPSGSFCSDTFDYGPSCGYCPEGTTRCGARESPDECTPNEALCGGECCPFGCCGGTCCLGECCNGQCCEGQCCNGQCIDFGAPCEPCACKDRECCSGKCCASKNSVCYGDTCASQCGTREVEACADGFQLQLNGLCLELVYGTWGASRARCKELGGALASVATKAELESVAAACDPNPLCWVTVMQASNSTAPNAGWTTTTPTGQRLPLNPAFWDTISGQPDDEPAPGEDNSQNCGAVRGRPFGKLHDYACNASLYAVCVFTGIKRIEPTYCVEPNVCCRGKCVDPILGDPTLPCKGLCCDNLTLMGTSPKNVSAPILKKNGWCCNNKCCTGSEVCCRGPDGLGCGTKCGTKCCRNGSKCCGGRCVSDQVYCDGLCCTGSKGHPAACCTNPKTGKKACC